MDVVVAPTVLVPAFGGVAAWLANRRKHAAQAQAMPIVGLLVGAAVSIAFLANAESLAELLVRTTEKQVIILVEVLGVSVRFMRANRIDVRDLLDVTLAIIFREIAHDETAGARDDGSGQRGSVASESGKLRRGAKRRGTVERVRVSYWSWRSALRIISSVRSSRYLRSSDA